MPDTIKPGRYVTMDGVRGVAAFCVASFHVTRTHWPAGGFLMVDLFFCLSGFVLAGSYGAALDKGLSPFAFVKLRVTRLYPLFALALLLGMGAHGIALYMGSGGTGGFTAVLMGLQALFMLPTMIPSQIGFGGLYNVNSPFPFNPPGWSLFFELIANIVFAYLRPDGARKAWRLAAIMALGFVVSVAILGHPGGWSMSSFWGGAPRVLSGFYIGCLVRQLADAGLLPAWRLPLVAPALTLAVAYAPLGAENPVFLFCAIFVSPLILITALRDLEAPWLNRAYAELGRLSYPIYVLHMPALKLFMIAGAVATSARAYQPSPAMDCIFLAGIAFVSWLVAVYVEPPLRRGFARLLSMRRREGPAGLAVAAD